MAYEKYACKFWAKEVLRNWYCDMSIKTRVINILKVRFFISENGRRLSYGKIILIEKFKKDKKCTFALGELAEWSNAVVLKTTVP